MTNDYSFIFVYFGHDRLILDIEAAMSPAIGIYVAAFILYDFGSYHDIHTLRYMCTTYKEVALYMHG